MSLKEEVYNECHNRLQTKIKYLQSMLDDLKESAANETKSTAGDKHETALAMLQIEQENANRQLKELYLQKIILDKIDVTITPVAGTLGSLIKTNKGYFFISIALGKMEIDDKLILAVSPKAPLGAKLMGAKKDDELEFNGNRYIVQSIL